VQQSARCRSGPFPKEAAAQDGGTVPLDFNREKLRRIRVTRTLMLLALILAVTAPAAHAGGYLGGGVGQAYTKVKETDFSIDLDGDTTGWKIFAGYNFLKFFGIEASYVDFGEVKDASTGTEIKTEAKTFDAFAVGKIPFPVVEPFVKIGYANVDSKITVEGLGSDSDKSWELAWGVGVGFNILKKLHVRVEYEQFDLSPDYDGVKPDSDLYMVSAAAAWRF